jgi:hypothetical protein
VRYLILFSIVFSLSSCTQALQKKARQLKSKDDTCVNKEAKQNAAGLRLPVAISYRMPASWQRTEDTSPMKFEERIIDPISQAKIKVFYFEGMKEKNEANVERWKNQFEEVDRELISEEVLMINEIPVLEFIMSGTYIDKAQPMNPDSAVTLRPGSTMKAYIVETQTGTWFFKAVAPSNVINIQENNFDTLVKSIKESY